MEEHFEFELFNEEPIVCMLCDDMFEVHNDYQLFLKHLLDKHKFVIGDPKEIADFRCYVHYWKKLGFSHLDDYCIVYGTNTENEARNASEKYYLLCDKLPEDKGMRTTLKQMKIKYIMQQKEEECQDREFSRQCIYCSAVIGGGVANSFRHLISDHSFHLGKPENIVHGAKLLDMMADMLNSLKCLYCEKTFKNHTILRQHMRKKQHRSLNPNNKQYDKFYIINHLMPGVPWQEAKKDVFTERDIPFPLQMEAREISLPCEIEVKNEQDVFDDEMQWMEWRDENEDIPAICLFCPFVTTNVEYVLFEHMDNCHSFNFQTLTKHLNFYSKVKLINYIRTQERKNHCVGCNLSFSLKEFKDHGKSCNFSSLPSVQFWDNPLYMIPVLENDSLLTHIEDTDVEDEDSSSLASSLNEEVVLLEDSFELPSIVNAWKLHEELSEDDNETESKINQRLYFKCFFCRFFAKGKRGRNTCIAHMNSFHNFNYTQTFKNMPQQNINKAVNYIRTMTALGKCFVCEKCYNKQVSLEGHRILEEHISFSSMNAFESDRWEKNYMPNDGFQISKHR